MATSIRARIARHVPGGFGRIIPNTSSVPPEKGVQALEQAVREVDRAVKELSKAAESSMDGDASYEERLDELENNAPTFIRDVSLTDGTYVHVTHDFGTVPSFIAISAPRSADPAVLVTATGRIFTVPSNAATRESDPTVEVVIRSAGFGMVVLVDVAVYP